MMQDPEVIQDIEEDISSRSTRDIWRLVSRTRSGQQQLEAIAGEAIKRVQHRRAWRQFLSYIPWLIIAIIIVGAILLLFGPQQISDAVIHFVQQQPRVSVSQ